MLWELASIQLQELWKEYHFANNIFSVKDLDHLSGMGPAPWKKGLLPAPLQAGAEAVRHHEISGSRHQLQFPAREMLPLHQRSEPSQPRLHQENEQSLIKNEEALAW